MSSPNARTVEKFIGKGRILNTCRTFSNRILPISPRKSNNAAEILPVGKLPHELLEKIIRSAPTSGSRVLLGPGVGLDCAVLEFGDTCLVLKTEPITFASDELGWYAVQIAANDIATTGARPKWAMFTVLLPSGVTTEQSVTNLADQLYAACRGAGITVIGGHTEVTHDLTRPLSSPPCSAKFPRNN